MIINNKLLSIPPFISTSWRDVELLLSDGQHTLNIYLKNGTLVKISHLLKDQLDLIFKVHQDVLLNQNTDKKPPFLDPLMVQFSGQILEHDPELFDFQPLPDDMLGKLKALSSALPKPDKDRMPQIHPGCRCPHCQIMTVILEEQDNDDLVDDSDLTFATWLQEELTDHDFLITHPYNKEETYLVTLGEKVCCSCGQMPCEHIEHVLKN